jgi:hypothetical protein
VYGYTKPLARSMLYVMLSRCHSLRQVRLVRPLDVADRALIGPSDDLLRLDDRLRRLQVPSLRPTAEQDAAHTSMLTAAKAASIDAKSALVARHKWYSAQVKRAKALATISKDNQFGVIIIICVCFSLV